MLTDTATVPQRSYVYDDWGKLIGGTDAAAFANRDRVRWKGALWLGPEADLYYMRNRWYESGTGRFLSEDPIGLEGGINPYVFAGSEPINGSDPSGMECIFQWVPEAWVTTPSGTSYQPGYYKANCRNQGTGRGAQLPSFGLGGALGGTSKQRAAARSCRAGALSGSAFEFFMLRDIRSQADALLQLSLVDSRERHKWIIRAGNGIPQFGASTRIGAPNAGMVLVGAPPRSAIGEFHTHPDVAPGVPGGPPSPNDASRAYGFRIPSFVQSSTERYAVNCNYEYSRLR